MIPRPLLGALLVVLVAGCSATTESPAPSPSGGSTASSPTEEPSAASAAPEATAPEAWAPISFKGSGIRRTKPFTLHLPARVDVTYAGSSSFVSSIGAVGDGLVFQELADTVGKTRLTTYVYGSGTQSSYVNVLADAPWTIKITPNVPDPKPAPASFSGRWGLMTPLLSLKGDYTVSFSHKGKGDFDVDLTPPGGDLFSLIRVAYGSGKVDVSTGLHGLDGDYAFEVLSDGPWSITIEPE